MGGEPAEDYSTGASSVALVAEVKLSKAQKDLKKAAKGTKSIASFFKAKKWFFYKKFKVKLYILKFKLKNEKTVHLIFYQLEKNFITAKFKTIKYLNFSLIFCF